MAGIAIAYNYPKVLTNADWQKKKGLIGKAKPTGIGAKLDAAEAACKKIDFAKLSTRANGQPNTMDELKVAIKTAKDYYAKTVIPFSKALEDLQKQAEAAKKDVAKLPMSGKVVKAIDEIIKQAANDRVAMKSFDFEADIKDATERIQRRQELAAKHLNDSLKKFVEGAKKFLSDPTPKSWESNIKQQGRSVSNSVKELGGYKEKFWSTFEKFKGFDLNTLKLDANDEKFGDKATKIVKLAADQVKQIAAFKP